MTAVSIITPAHDAEAFIGRSVRSALAQTHDDWEMIIIADDGRDYRQLLATQGIADSRLRFVSTEGIGAGPGIARNIGLDVASYDIVTHLDSDDCYGKNFLSRVIPAIEQHGACHTAVRFIDMETSEEKPVKDFLLEDGPLAMPLLLHQCLTYVNIGFDRRRCDVRWPELRYGEDLLLWLRILDKLPAIYFLSSTHYDYYFRKGSLSRPDEATTHVLCERRRHMIEWLKTVNPPIRNIANRDFMIRWMEEINDAEEAFNYRLVDISTYKAEMDQRFERLIAGKR